MDLDEIKVLIAARPPKAASQSDNDEVKPSVQARVSGSKSKDDPNHRWRRFLLANEEISQLGYIIKRRGIFAKRRMLILTALPRLIYINPDSMEKKGEVPWSASL